MNDTIDTIDIIHITTDSNMNLNVIEHTILYILQYIYIISYKIFFIYCITRSIICITFSFNVYILYDEATF
ncbi:hypothetical protein D3C87_879850 [compost metagenome]